MADRVGALHVTYRIPRGGPAVAAVPAALDRAVRAGLARALEERLASALADDGEVVVIREVSARVRLDRLDWSLDGRALERICRSSLDAVAAALAHGPPDAVARWPSETDFVGAFVLELLAGTAFDRWYFGAFERYRRADPRATLEALLADRGPEVPGLFTWLAGRGALDAVLALLGPAALRRLVPGASAGPGEGPPPDLRPLAAAAFRLLALLGLPLPGAEAEQRCLERFRAAHPASPPWTDRALLGAWVLALVRFAVGEALAAGAPPPAPDREALTRELSGPLDWLDGAALLPGLLAAAGEDLRAPAEAAPISLATAAVRIRRERALAGVLAAVRARGIPVERATADALLVRLLAQLASDAPGGRPDPTLAATVERVVLAWRALVDAAPDRARALALVEDGRAARAGSAAGGEAEVRIAELRAAGPGARALLRALLEMTALPAAGAESRGAALFLLARPMLDLRLPGLARAREVPLPPLLAALAERWLGLEPPFDAATALWIGAEPPDLAALAPGPLGQLADDVTRVLREQSVVEGDAAPLTGDGDGLPEPSPEPCVERAVATLAAAVLRAFARWLPGLPGASARFLTDGCLRRGGAVEAGRDAIDVRLDPAPLDVVLELAGYLRPLEAVPWLGGRAVRFAVRRAPRVGPP